MIVEQSHLKKLRKLGINICTKYKSNNVILERNTNNTKNDNIKEGICLEKNYYKDNKLLCKISGFDPRIQYTYIKSNNGENEVTCPNCGHVSKEKDIIDGCPYCGTNYNIEYLDKDLGTKYHYDRVLQGSNYRSITLVIDILISAVLVFIYIFTTGRTFNIYDISKIAVGTIILSLILYYLFYMIDAMIIVLPVKLYKDRINQKQIEFWKRMEKLNVSKKIFYNNVNYELQEYYYGEESKNKDIIDYDIIDYISLKEKKLKNNKIIVTLRARIREVELKDNVISKKIVKKEFTFEKNNEPIEKIGNGVNIIKCHNCGVAIDVTKRKCEYCGTRINSYQEWYLVTDANK